MKRHLMLIINLFTFIFIVPFLIFLYVITGLVIGLAFDLDSYLIPGSKATAHPRLKHIVMLPPIKLAPVVTEVEPAQVAIPATPIESEPEPQEFVAVETATLSTTSQSVEETVVASISAPVQNLAVDDEVPTEIITVEPTPLETADEPEPSMATSPTAEEANTAEPQDETPVSAENSTPDLSPVEPTSAEPVESEIVEVAEETTLPVSSPAKDTEQVEIAAPPQDDPPTPSEPVPDASYFDKLLDQVKQ